MSRLKRTVYFQNRCSVKHGDQDIADHNGVSDRSDGEWGRRLVNDLNDQESGNSKRLTNKKQRNRNQQDSEIDRQQDTARRRVLTISLTSPRGVRHQPKTDRDQHKSI